MPQAKPGGGPRKVALLGLVTLALLAPPAWAYVNGGTYHTTLGRYERRLKAAGWRVSCGVPKPTDGEGPIKGVEAGVPGGSTDGPAYDRWVNRLVGRALQALPKKDAAKVPDEAKRRVARLAREAIGEALWKKWDVIKEGRTGPLRYRVGAYAFETYWEASERGRRKLYPGRKGLVPFVAVKLVERRDRDKD
jgi:hypothetical protein